MPNTPQQLGRTLSDPDTTHENEANTDENPETTKRDLARQIDLIFAWHYMHRNAFRAPNTNYKRTKRAPLKRRVP